MEYEPVMAGSVLFARLTPEVLVRCRPGRRRVLGLGLGWFWDIKVRNGLAIATGWRDGRCRRGIYGFAHSNFVIVGWLRFDAVNQPQRMSYASRFQQMI
jgi:hypothetical protein